MRLSKGTGGLGEIGEEVIGVGHVEVLLARTGRYEDTLQRLILVNKHD